MTKPLTRDERVAAPILAAANMAGSLVTVPSARAIGRSFPPGEHTGRLLLGVAEGIGDPPSAEAQAAEALGRLEQTAARAPEGASSAGVLEAAYAEADEAITRLNGLPGSVPGAGAALLAAIVSGNNATIANLGRGAAFLRRGGALRRLTSDHRWSAATQQAEFGAPGDPEATVEFGGRTPLGAGDQAMPEIAAPLALQAGDTLVLCSEAVVRRLGARVINAVLDEFDPEQAADQLSRLAAEQEGVSGAAVTVLHLPGAAVPVLPAVAPTAAAPLTPGYGRRRWAISLAVFAGAILAGAAAAGAVLYARSNNNNSPTATATVLVRTGPASPAPAAVVSTATAAAAAASPAARAATPRPGSPVASGGTAAGGQRSPTAGTPGGVAAVPGASPTPVVVASLPPCDGNGNRPPCRYKALPGDSVSAIGDKFNLTRACFEAANRSHVPVPAPPTYPIRVADEYAVLDQQGCAAIVTATPAPAAITPLAAASTTPVSTTVTPRPACTPRPGAAVANPVC